MLCQDRSFKNIRILKSGEAQTHLPKDKLESLDHKHHVRRVNPTPGLRSYLLVLQPHSLSPPTVNPCFFKHPFYFLKKHFVSSLFCVIIYVFQGLDDLASFDYFSQLFEKRDIYPFIT